MVKKQLKMKTDKKFKRGVDCIGVGVGGAIINEKNEILLFLRNVNPEKGYWSIPGGGVEFGEAIEDAVIRELYEELGIQVEVVELLGIANHIVKENKSHWVSPEFHVKIVSGIPKNLEKEKHIEMKWFSLDNLPEPIAIPAKVAIDGYIKLHGLF